MNADVVPMALLMTAIALSWPEFVGMFRLRANPTVTQSAIMTLACAAGLGAAGLAIQNFGIMPGGLVCLLGILAGQFLRNDARMARAEAFLSVGCIAVVVAGHPFG